MIDVAVDRLEVESFRGRSAFTEARKPERRARAVAGALVRAARWSMDDPRVNRNGPPAEWVTPVLGSGCPRATDAALRAHLEAIPASVAAALEPDRLPDGRRSADVARQFARHLIDERATRLGPLTYDEDSTDQLTCGRAHVLLAAALLTELYHVLARAGGGPLSSRSDRDVCLEANLPGGPRIRRELLTTATDALQTARELAAGEPTVTTAVDSFEQVVHQVGPVLALTSGRLDAATERCWQAMIPPQVPPPSWSDVNFDVAGPLTAPVPGYFARLNALEDGVRARMEEPTKASWNVIRQRLSAEATPPVAGPSDQIWNTAALLLAQAKRRRDETQRRKQPPVASAFVTGFDLELEMALLCQSEHPFLVAMPVALRIGPDGSSRAVLCWLGVEITVPRRGPSLGRLSGPHPPERWHVLSNKKNFGFEPQLVGMPVVVHLSGCPLIDLPEDGDLEHLRRDLATALPVDIGPRDELALKHAVVIDEYVALQQANSDAFVYPSTTGETRHVRTVGLPGPITGAAPDFRRYWVLFGVQIGDVGTRLRVTTRMLRQVLGPISPQQSRAVGVAINRELRDTERALLMWSGFDVVTDVDALDFAADLLEAAKLLSPEVGRADAQ
jgi:hypothetical protein